MNLWSVLLLSVVFVSSAWGQNVITWSDNSNNEQGFYLERAPAITGPFARIATLGIYVEVHTDPVGVIGHCYRLQAWNAAGNSAYSNIACRVPPPQPPDTLLQTSCSQATIPDPPLPSGLVLFLNFNEASGNTVLDSSGAGNNGTIFGAARTTAGKYGAALTFDGVNDYVTIGDVDLTGSFTIAMWAKATNLGSGCHGSAVMKRYDYGFEVCSGAMLGQVGKGIGPGWAASTNYPIPQVGVWNHYALTYDGTTARLYVNGNQVSTATGTHSTNNNPLQIGSWTTGSEFFSGAIDEVRLYNRALSASQLQTDMNTAVIP